ncbi:MAG: hypothetical protein IJI22_00955 [Bacilli bacterium]|nr:hypothetical protein [Bacilli bacterium]
MKKKQNEQRLVLKLLACLIYLIVITILFVYTYKLYDEKNKLTPWNEVESTEEYTYIDIFKMSEKFAFYEDSNIGIHFVIEKENTGQWHTYLIAINEADYDKYKDIIDYTYERTDKVPEIIRVYGYPKLVDNDLKDLAIKNISNFIPAENEIVITNENYETYLTNSYLDTTKEKKDEFNIMLFITALLLATAIILLILTILDKDRIVDNLDEKIEEDLEKTKELFKIKDKKKEE